MDKFNSASVCVPLPGCCLGDTPVSKTTKTDLLFLSVLTVGLWYYGWLPLNFESHTLNQKILTTTRKSICHANNSKTPVGVVKGGIAPGEYWQIDFSELSNCRYYKDLIVLVDTSSRCSEAFHCCTS